MKLLIAIHGSHSQPEQMQAQRETWLADVRVFPLTWDADHHTLDYKYFLGRPDSEDEDIVSLDMPDGPSWNPDNRGHRTGVGQRKTEALAAYALENGYDYVFKCDDDTYVQVDRLLSSGFEQHDYSGSMDRHYAFGFGWYEWAQGGAGYWLSRKAMEVIAEHGLHLVPAEDFAVGQLLARNGIAAYHDARYAPDAKEHSNIATDLITLHKVNPAWMRRVYAGV